MNWSVWFNACTINCIAWNAHVQRAQKASKSFLASPVRSYFPYDRFEPVWNCRSKERLPAKGGDGPKFICGLHVYDASSTDYVFSLGSNGDTQFEDAIRVKLPHARIITVDPTLTPTNAAKVQGKKHIHFLNVAVGSETTTTIGKKVYSSVSLKNLTDTYEPTRILKIDIEGGERTVFSPKTPCSVLKNIDQVLVEIHGTKPQQVFEWFSACNMLMYSKEPNIWGCHGRVCGEYSFLTADFAYREYLAS